MTAPETEIISIADRYDAMTSARVYRKKGLPPDTALGILLKDSGSKINPIMMNFFIMMIGLFPITGIPLPLMSQGGSAAISTFLALGLAMSVNMRRFVN